MASISVQFPFTTVSVAVVLTVMVAALATPGRTIRQLTTPMTPKQDLRCITPSLVAVGS